MKRIQSWGRLSNDPHHLTELPDSQSLPALHAATAITYGMGRSYGDICLNRDGQLFRTAALDKFIHFDSGTGILQCEAGVLLEDIQKTFVPRGWMLPVTPGTWFVTVGGAIANDVHGKNHHVFGSFGHNTQAFQLARTDGQILHCDRNQNSEMFRATIGGLGLTGVILQATLQLRPVQSCWMTTESLPYNNLPEFFELSDESEKSWEYTVSWFDCVHGVGRGIFSRARHSADNRMTPDPVKQKTVPFTPPLSMINRLTVSLFNSMYFQYCNWRKGTAVLQYQPFLYPLDNLLHWNRLYGPKGFYQYQCVIPTAHRLAAVSELLKLIKVSGMGSFLTVLKTFGERPSDGLLSFPQPGVTLAIDFQNQGWRTLELFKKMDAVVLEAGGRIYLAKDARLPRTTFERMYPDLATFISHRDPGLASDMSRRLMDSPV